MENRQMKCIKGESCLYCGSNYCRFVDELYQLKQTLTEIKEICDTYQMGYIVNNGVKLLITKILQIIGDE